MEENRGIAMNNSPLVAEHYSDVRAGIVELLNAARTASVRSVNALMTATYWEIGRRIVESEQEGQERAEYGEALIRQLASDLEFLNLKDEYSESDLEEALIQHLTEFLLELGDDFAFLGRQRRLRIDTLGFALTWSSSTGACVAWSSSI
jgi:predicted nuclease of restriction endonuclease-like (RecB) superfamily